MGNSWDQILELLTRLHNFSQKCNTQPHQDSFINNAIEWLILCLCVSDVCTKWKYHIWQCACGGQKTTLWCQFPPLTFKWNTGIEFIWQVCVENDYLQSCFHSSRHFISITPGLTQIMRYKNIRNICLITIC